MNTSNRLTETTNSSFDQAKPDNNIESINHAIVEIIGDAGEGSQSVGQIFGTVSARMGNGVWTAEIIPAEIEPLARTRSSASGSRIRVGLDPVTNMGDNANVVIAFNEQVPYSRIDKGAFKKGTQIFLESKWADDQNKSVRSAYFKAVTDFNNREYIVHEIPMEKECLKHVSDPRRGKNMWVLGLLCSLYDRNLEIAREEVARKFSNKDKKIVEQNLTLLQTGYDWALYNIQFRYKLLIRKSPVPMVVMNGNQAIALGAMAAGFEACAMYPITPATSVSHYLASAFKNVGGFLHQAEDEIAAIGFAIGASYAGKTALTITSGPGLALKTEFIGLAVMAEIPLVIVDVQRGGPATGLPTRVEQSDLLASLYASPGDSPKIIIAPSSIEECFHFMITARKLAETFRGPVLVLSDATLAAGVQPFPQPKIREEMLAPPLDQSTWDENVKPFNWDSETGISQRPIPGQKGGEYTLTGLAHDKNSQVNYVSIINQQATKMRSRKLVALQKSLKLPEIFGDESGDLLVVGWGSTRGTIEEAVARVRQDGGRVSSLHLRFLSPLEPGLKKIFSRFKQVMTVENNYSDNLKSSQINEDNRRYAQLALCLRVHTLVDVDCYSMVHGISFSPQAIEKELKRIINLM